MLPVPWAHGARPGHRPWLRACRADTQQKERDKMIPRVGPVYTGDVGGLRAHGTGDVGSPRHVAQVMVRFLELRAVWFTSLHFAGNGGGGCVCARRREPPAEVRADSVLPRSASINTRARPASRFPDCCRRQHTLRQPPVPTPSAAPGLAHTGT